MPLSSGSPLHSHAPLDLHQLCPLLLKFPSIKSFLVIEGHVWRRILGNCYSAVTLSLTNILLSFQWLHLLAELLRKIIWKSAGKIWQTCQSSNETCFIYAHKKTRKHRMDASGSSCLVINYSAWVIYWSIMFLPHPSHKQLTVTWDGIVKQIK